MRTEPGSWTVVGCLPIYNNKATKRPKKGPFSSRRRKIDILHLSYARLFEDFNRKTLNAQRLRWADGIFRWSLFILAMHLGDQPEHDTILCEGSQTCKLCMCPRGKLHETGERFSVRSGVDDKSLVYRAAFGGDLPAYDQLNEGDRGARGGKKFKFFKVEKSTDGRSKWITFATYTSPVRTYTSP